jgi:YbbR domain-containing protein
MRAAFCIFNLSFLIQTMRDLLIKDWGWKLFSLFLAVAIWLTVHKIIEEPKESAAFANANQVTYGNLPLLIVASASDVHLYRVVPDTVSVTVSGSPDAIAVLQANQIRATVDLTAIESARDLRRRVDVSVPSGIELVSVAPAKVGIIIPPPRH